MTERPTPEQVREWWDIAERGKTPPWSVAVPALCTEVERLRERERVLSEMLRFVTGTFQAHLFDEGRLTYPDLDRTCPGSYWSSIRDALAALAGQAEGGQDG